MLRHGVLRVMLVSFCTGHFVMVLLNLTYLHCLQPFFLNIFSIYIKKAYTIGAEQTVDFPRLIVVMTSLYIGCTSRIIPLSVVIYI